MNEKAIEAFELALEKKLGYLPLVVTDTCPAISERLGKRTEQYGSYITIPGPWVTDGEVIEGAKLLGAQAGRSLMRLKRRRQPVIYVQLLEKDSYITEYDEEGNPTGRRFPVHDVGWKATVIKQKGAYGRYERK
jgi:hypothetical protein